MKIGNFLIGETNVFVIAEIGNNHNGDIDIALKMIDSAISSGADCVKFQMRDMGSLYRKKTLKKQSEDLGTEYILDLLNKVQLSVEEHKRLAQYCASKGILYLCTPWDPLSISVLESFEVPAYKVASADLTNLPLIKKLIETKKPLILSTGMSSENEIQTTVNFLNENNTEFALLHCNSTYPAPFHDINLSWLQSLNKIHPLIGYSGHERGIAVSISAVALGAKIIERHYTFDRNMEGPDHAASLEPKEFQTMVTGIREVEKAMGTKAKRVLTQGEMINRENLAKSLVAACHIKEGTLIESHHLSVKSPGQGLSVQFYDQLLGRKILREMYEDDYFYLSDLNENKLMPRNYQFTRPWGVPVRYHDFAQYSSMIQPNFFEFHLSYSDLDLDIENYLSGQYPFEFIVHAPELFSESRILDLASVDDEYRKFSIFEMQRVINITRSLKRFFPNTKIPMIVVNIGGFTMDELLPKSQINDYYKRFSKSLLSLDTDGIEILPQTMAPFPWHFGGQRFQNLFVYPKEIIFWCNKLNLRMCFDVSHSRLLCNHAQINFYEFAEQIAPITGHLHLGDALGVNGEGLQIGDGDIDFSRLGKILNKYCPRAPFIPEIWQGHKNNGEGFWYALEKIENYLGE